MITKAIKAGLTLSVCLLGSQGLAQNVTAQLRIDTQLKSYQNGTNKIPALSLSGTSLPPTLKWLNQNPTPEVRQQGLQQIHQSTLDSLKSFHSIRQLGGLDGGGGSAWVCEQVGKYSVELLDLWEARANGLQLDFGPGKTFTEKIDYVLDRLAKISPVRAHTYQAMANDLLNNQTLWLSNASMPIVNDTKLMLYPKGCLLVQVAVQNPIEQRFLPSSKTYKVNKDLFYLLDENSKAALVLHEILYREARFSNIQNSVFIRDLVGVLASESLTKYNLKTLNTLLESNGVKCLESMDFPVMFPLETYEQGFASCDHIGHLAKTKTKPRRQIFNFTPDQTNLRTSLVYEGSQPLVGYDDFVEHDYDSSWARYVGQHYISVLLEGSLSYRVHGKDNSSLNIPIRIDDGGFRFTSTLYVSYSKSPHFYKMGNFEYHEYKLFKKVNGSAPYNAEMVKMNTMTLKGKVIRIDHPLVKLMYKCDPIDDECAAFVEITNDDRGWASISFREDSKFEDTDSTSFLVYVGNNDKVSTQNGWLKTTRLHFKNGKLHRVYIKDAAKDASDSNYNEIYYNLETQELEELP